MDINLATIINTCKDSKLRCHYFETLGCYYALKKNDGSKTALEKIIKKENVFYSGIYDLSVCFPHNSMDEFVLYRMVKTKPEKLQFSIFNGITGYRSDRVDPSSLCFDFKYNSVEQNNYYAELANWILNDVEPKSTMNMHFGTVQANDASADIQNDVRIDPQSYHDIVEGTGEQIPGLSITEFSFANGQAVKIAKVPKVESHQKKYTGYPFPIVQIESDGTKKMPHDTTEGEIWVINNFPSGKERKNRPCIILGEYDEHYLMILSCTSNEESVKWKTYPLTTKFSLNNVAAIIPSHAVLKIQMVHNKNLTRKVGVLNEKDMKQLKKYFDEAKNAREHKGECIKITPRDNTDKLWNTRWFP